MEKNYRKSYGTLGVFMIISGGVAWFVLIIGIVMYTRSFISNVNDHIKYHDVYYKRCCPKD